MKIPSGSELSVKLQPTHKIIDRILRLCRQPGPDAGRLQADARARTPAAQAQGGAGAAEAQPARYVVQNDVSTLAEGEDHVFFVHENGSSRVRRYVGREKLATALAVLLDEQLGGSPG